MTIPAGKRTVPAELRSRLAEMLRPDMERLAEWMPAGFDAWGMLSRR
jgi:hypothetical protein